MRNKWVRFIAVVLILVFASMSIQATSSERLEELKKQEEAQEAKQNALDKKRQEQVVLKKNIESAYRELEGKLEANDVAVKQIVSSIQSLELEIADMNLVIEELEVSLEAKQNEIERVRIDLEQVREEQDDLHENAKERIRVVYEYGEAGFLEIMFDSEDLMDFFSRLEYISRLVEADKKMFDSLGRYEADISASEVALEIHEENLQHLTNEATLEKSKLDNKVTSKNLEVENAQRIIDQQKAYRSTLSTEKAEAQKELDALEAEEARVDQELDEILKLKAAEINRIMGLDYSGGSMVWPLPGWYRLSSPFGPRLHPIQKTWKNHNGVDIPASSGTPILAAERGEVVISKYSSSYGNYIAISHGNGYLTLYAHCSSRAVEVGDQVNAGDVIGKVGTTGWSTGNHLHYGVQKDGVWVDPMQFH